MGNAAEWVGALAGVGALIAAIFAGIYGARLYRVEAERDRVERERRAREEPSRVNAWQAVKVCDGSRKYGLVVANRGENPVYDVDLAAMTWAKGAAQDATQLTPLRLRILPPGTYYFEHVGGQFHWDFGEDVAAVDGTVRPVMKTDKLAVQGLEFRDSADIRWRRDASGLLAPADDGAEGAPVW